jgi:hypothetical protein
MLYRPSSYCCLILCSCSLSSILLEAYFMLALWVRLSSEKDKPTSRLRYMAGMPYRDAVFWVYDGSQLAACKCFREAIEESL